MSLSRKSPKDPVSLHHCPQCDRAYERPDHLARHLDSHRNERTFQCPVCHRGFNRRDVLQRHRLIHASGRPVSKHKGRVIEACEECAASKVSCDHSRPCSRCQRKGIPCVSRKLRSPKETLYTPNSEEGLSEGFPAEDDTVDHDVSPSAELVQHEDISPQMPLAFAERNAAVSLPDTPASSVLPPTGLLPGLEHAFDNHGVAYRDVHDFPAFFEQVMMPLDTSRPGAPGIQQPRGVFDFMLDPEFASPDAGLFNTDIITDLDRILEADHSPAATNTRSEIGMEDQSTKQRVAAFRRSLWLWVPEKNQNGFTGEAQIPLKDGDMTASISMLHRSRLEALNIRGKLSSQLRDNIFQLIMRTARSRLAVPSFPTAESLDTLIKIGISKRTETDAWIHPYTLYDQDARPELMTALVAAGCVCCGIPSINKTGVLLLEILRVSLSHLAESDNSVLRDLQYFQASMMWLDIGIFCGYKRKMQIAESNLQPLCTALRRAGAFDRSFYSPGLPLHELDGDSLQSAWYDWIRQESWKRLAYHLFEHDVEAAAAMNRPALTSYTEFTLPFPSSRELWLAPTAATWKHLLQTEYSYTAPSQMSLRALLADPSLLSHLPSNLDHGVINSSILHGLMSQVWEFRQQALLSPSPYSERRATAQLWLQSRQDDLLFSIQTAMRDMTNAPAIATLLGEFAMMYLHINLDSIQRFAGQFGELEARHEYPRLREWSSTREARTAIWHAGQVFRAARLVPPYQLRGFDSLSLYHATLVLWVFGLLRCGEEQEHEHEQYPGSSSSRHATTTTDTVITLDGPEDEFTRVFVNRNTGRPGLTLHLVDAEGEDTSVFCPLSSPRLVMDVARQVFEGNCQGAADNLPPLVDNLCNLIRELGSLP